MKHTQCSCTRVGYVCVVVKPLQQSKKISTKKFIHAVYMYKHFNFFEKAKSTVPGVHLDAIGVDIDMLKDNMQV